MPPFIHKPVYKCWILLAEALFPRKCFGCSNPGKYFCPACVDKIFRAECEKLGEIDLILSFSSYREPSVKNALRRLKYGSASDIALELAEMMSGRLPKTALSGIKPLVVAVPMTDKRKRARGFNQAELLAQKFAEKTDFEFSPALLKARETKPQAEIKNREERFLNVKNAFSIAEGALLPEEIIVVDDIITTGATMREAARVLKSAGVQKVIALAVARG